FLEIPPGFAARRLGGAPTAVGVLALLATAAPALLIPSAAQAQFVCTNGVSADGATATKAGAVACGTNAAATGANSPATGAGPVASGDSSTAQGQTSTASGLQSTAQGFNSLADGSMST